MITNYYNCQEKCPFYENFCLSSFIVLPKYTKKYTRQPCLVKLPVILNYSFILSLYFLYTYLCEVCIFISHFPSHLCKYETNRLLNLHIKYIWFLLPFQFFNSHFIIFPSLDLAISIDIEYIPSMSITCAFLPVICT